MADKKVVVSFEKKTGYALNCVNIKYVSIWTTEMTTKGSMKFYGDSSYKDDMRVQYLIDIEYAKGSDDHIVVNHYPHNSSELFSDLTPEKQQEMHLLLSNLTAKYDGKRTSFTINYKRMEEVTKEHFNRYSPRVMGDDTFDAWVFETESPEDPRAFPKIHAIEIRKNIEEFMQVFPIQAWASKYLLPLAGKEPTTEGKYVSFLLLKAYLEGKYPKNCLNLASVNLPTKATTAMPTYLKTTELERFYNNHIRGKVTMAADGKFVDTSKAVTRHEESLPSAIVVFDPNEVRLQEKIIRDVLDKNCISLMDICQLGVAETLALIPTDKVVPVDLNIEGIAKKMCALGGFFYIIPLAETSLILDIEFGDRLVECESEEAFPLIFDSKKKGE